MFSFNKLLHYIFLHEEELVDKARLYKQARYNRKLVKTRIKDCQSGLDKNQYAELLRFWKRYVPSFTKDFHLWYTHSTGVFDVKYVPDDIWYQKIDPFYNNRRAAKYIDNKCLYQSLFSDVAKPKMIAWRCNGMWFNHENKLISINDLCNSELEKTGIFIKQATDSLGGHGVFYINGNDKDSCIKDVINKIKGDLVVQTALDQHREMARLNPSSVNTCRVLSLLSQDGVKCYSSIVRMGVGQSKVDNASSGGITCGIEADGRLKSIAYSQEGKRFLEHPTSGLHFDEIVVPNFKKILELTKEQHLHVPMFRLVSWDWAIDSDGIPTLIEANLCNGELDFHQMNNGPVFGNDTEKILDEVFRHS